MTTKEVIDKIFREPGVRFELTEFENLGKPIHEILSIYPKTAATGKDAGRTKYYLKSFIPFSTGNEEVQVYTEGGKSSPEEIVRQLWVYKLIQQYGYKEDEIGLEVGVQFGTEVGTKAADIVVYTSAAKATPKIIVECKKPKRKDGIEQLKSYMNAKGASVAIWSNGSDRMILYRPYPAQFDDTLFDLPKRGQEPKDVLEAKKTLLQLRRDFNFKKIIQDLEEVIVASFGGEEFHEILKLIFAKLWDEVEAQENRKNKVVEFGKSLDPDITYERIDNLFQKACDRWPGVFEDGEHIKLPKKQLQIFIGPIEGVRLTGSNLRIMDDAFEYLLPEEAKKKKGQFFTPRHVIDMCVRMLNPKRTEYVMDPACGSAGFLLHAMDWCYPAPDAETQEKRKHRYAARYLWGIDFESTAAKTSRALMLIAGDGHTNIFGPNVDSLDPRTWFDNVSGQKLMQGLRQEKLTAKRIPDHETLGDEDKAWEYFDELKLDVILANPPFAGERKDRTELVHFELAKRALKRAKDKQPKEERDVLFIERILKWLKPGGRAAIVLPQGKFNNSSLAFIREWILKKARLLAVVGLHPNTFKPHTGTKTSVLLVQKYTAAELAEIGKVHQDVAGKCPDYAGELRKLIEKHKKAADVPDEALPDAVAELLAEEFSEPDAEDGGEDGAARDDEGKEEADSADPEERLESARAALLKSKQRLMDLDSDVEALAQKNAQEAEIAGEQATGEKEEVRAKLKALRAGHGKAEQSLKEMQKGPRKALKAELRRMEAAVEVAERTLKTASTRGKLQLVLEDEELLGTLKERWIAAEVAKRLDYPIFMAVSERGGKDSSGEYIHVVDAEGSLVEFPPGHPQEGQQVIDQDLVNLHLRAADLADAASLPDEQVCIAEAFVRFAQKQGFGFWEVG